MSEGIYYNSLPYTGEYRECNQLCQKGYTTTDVRYNIQQQHVNVVKLQGIQNSVIIIIMYTITQAIVKL